MVSLFDVLHMLCNPRPSSRPDCIACSPNCLDRFAYNTPLPNFRHSVRNRLTF